VIYLDHNATTPIAPKVRETMLPHFSGDWGNPSSSYRFGSKLRSVIESAREQVADLIGAHPREILFTSCATESNNAAIHAALKANPGKQRIVTSAVEHSSVLSYCKALEAEGCRVTYLPVDREGLLNLADLENALTDETAVVSLMWANNETGVLFPIEKIAALCKSRAVLFHCDAVQAIGKLPVDVAKIPVDYLSITGHKFNAPKGIGALYVRRKTPFTPYLYGGHQERGLRGGTENVALIAGLGKAAELARNHVREYECKIRPLRDALEEGILNGGSSGCLPRRSNAEAGESAQNSINAQSSASAASQSRLTSAATELNGTKPCAFPTRPTSPSTASNPRRFYSCSIRKASARHPVLPVWRIPTNRRTWSRQ
jgi:cysteine desulfurase